MKLFYEKHIFFCTNLRKEKVSCGKHNSQELRDYMKKRVKELAIKKVRINSSGCLNRCKLGPLVVSYPEGNWYKISSKEDVDLFIDELLIKRRTFKKNLIEN
jgi:(2Fe-2S) ferredoxin